MNAIVEVATVQSVHEPIVKSRKDEEISTNGRPVYLYRSLFNEMSLLGSDLMVEPYDEGDF